MLQLEDLFDGDDALPTGDHSAQRVQHRRLARLRAARHQDVQAGDHRRLEEPRCLLGQGAHAHQLVEGVETQHELADVDRHVPAGDGRDHHVQPRPVGQGRVDERRAQVDAPPAGAQHPLDQLGDLVAGQDQRGEFGRPPAGDEHPARFVDPDLFDHGVVQQRLQRPEPGDRVLDETRDTGAVAQRGQLRGRGAVDVLGDDVVDQARDCRRIGDRVERPTAHELAHLALDDPARRRHPPSPVVRIVRVIRGSYDLLGVAGSRKRAPVDGARRRSPLTPHRPPVHREKSARNKSCRSPLWVLHCSTTSRSRQQHASSTPKDRRYP